MSDPVAELGQRLAAERYFADEGLLTAVHLALSLGRPLALEGEPGVGKTEIAKVLAQVLDRELIRLQCYEGLDAAQALYEWDHPKQLLAIRACEAEGRPVGELYDPEFLMERPLLRALRVPCVLLIDEIDRADSEFEAFLLEFLSDFQITIPEIGTIAAAEQPIVVMTSNRTRELHDALKRRCLYHWIAFPDAARERAIIDAKVPGLADEAAASLVAAVSQVRMLKLIKPPGIAETIEWARRRSCSPTRAPRGRSRCAARSACCSRSRRTRRPCSSTLRPSACERPLDGFLDDWRPIPEKRIDFLRALADNQPPDISAPVLARAGDARDAPGGHARLRRACSPPSSPARRRRSRPTEEGEEQAPQPKQAGELSPVELAEGTGKSASVHELVNRRSYDATAEDLAELRRALRRQLPTIRSRRRRPARRGAQIDLRRTLRAATRTGEITQLARRARPHRARPLLVLIDVSGSLRPQVPDYLRFAWAAQGETFTFGTRLTRITKELRERDVDAALANVSEIVSDADGGTRIGPALQEFLDTPRYADRARGALTIVLSDGLERGDPAPDGPRRPPPRRGSATGCCGGRRSALDPNYRPITRAMAAIQDDLDGLAGARDLPSLLEQVQAL